MLMQKVQNHQTKELEAISSETDYPGKIKALLEDLRVLRDQNKAIKSKLYEEEKKSRAAHSTMIQLEQTIRELKEI